MKTIKQYIIACIALSTTMTAQAQNLNSAYFTKDFQFRHEMNPAFENERNYVAIPILGNTNVAMRGNFGVEDVIFSNPMPGGKANTTFMNPYISPADALGGFHSGDNKVQADINIGLLSGGFKSWGGYNTVELNLRANVGAILPYELFEFAKQTGNKEYNIGDINAQAQSFMELAFGHSRQITDKLRLGAKVKVLLGVGRADLKMTDLRADLTEGNQWTISGNADADVSMKGFQATNKQKAFKKREGSYDYVDDVKVKGAGIGGYGLALDLGGIYKIDQDWTVSASLTDLGFISWNNDVQLSNESKEFVFDGFHDVHVKKEDPNSFKNQSESYSDQLAEFAHLKNQGDKGSRTTGIGATMRFAGEYNLPVYRPITFGLLSTTRINGKYTWTEGRLSANYEPLKWINGGINFAVNSFTTSMGWVVNIHPKGYNFFVGMDHILCKTNKNGIPLGSNASVSMGMSVTW